MSADTTDTEAATPRAEERRAKVNGSPYGSISWEEHVAAWKVYASRHGNDQDAECINARGGFGIQELTLALGHLPTTWQPSDATRLWKDRR